MIYLHSSDIVSHGHLKTSNCLVDSRWVLQITDFGLHEFKAGQENHKRSYADYSSLLWDAPEIRRAAARPSRGTQKGDVYSFAIILHEIIRRKGPWGPTGLTYKGNLITLYISLSDFVNCAIHIKILSNK